MTLTAIARADNNFYIYNIHMRVIFAWIFEHLLKFLTRTLL